MMGAHFRAGGPVSTTKSKSSAQTKVQACQKTIPESSEGFIGQGHVLKVNF